jgi:serine/threonine protein phosphatase PrpC
MLDAFGISDAGCVRNNNEDYFLLVPPLDLYLIADGMGGAQAGEHAAKLAVDTVVECVLKSGQKSGEVLLKAIEEANRRVITAAGNDTTLHGMGTTLTACWRVGDELLFANVGDSRAYVYQDGQLHVITDDQTWVNEVGRRLGIGDEQLKTHHMRHVLTMAIGVSDSLRINSYAVPLRGESLFLMCSDGLHGVVGPSHIASVMRNGDSLETKCRALIEAARGAGGPDNITAVLVRASNGQ